MKTYFRHKGVRIELGEIETVLLQSDLLVKVAVVAKEDEEGNMKLFGYVVVNHTFDKDGIVAYLSARVPGYMVPGTWIEIKSLPLTANGEIDRECLCLDDISTHRSGIAATPRSEVEFKLTEIWKKLLDIPEVSIYDNFFTLGGHSLLAIRLLNEVKKVFHKNLPLITLLKAVTIEKLATILQRNCEELWSPLIAIQAKGSKPPLFLIHDGFGQVFTYRNLAYCLDPDRPVYGLQAQGLDGEKKPRVRIEDMAGEYIKKIEILQPEGPYHLAGLCVGGIIALEMAQQLKRKGKHVGVLAFLGTRYNSLSLPANAIYRDYISRLTIPEKLALGIRNIRKVFGKSYFNETQSSLNSLLDYEIYSIHCKALDYYKPESYPGDLITFWASRDQRFSASEQLLWSNIVRGSLQCYDFPGNHMNPVINGPYCKKVVEILRARLDEVDNGTFRQATLESAKNLEETRLSATAESINFNKGWSSIIAIQPKGFNPPIFCIHGLEILFTGEVHYAYELSRSLGPEQPVYGLQAQGLDGRTKPHRRIKDIAAHYIKEVETIQQNGNYFLAGLGFGGLVALEMARQLTIHGKHVPLLILFDSPGVNNSFHPSTGILKNNEKIDPVKEKKEKVISKISLLIKYPLSNLRTYIYLRQHLMRAQKNYIPEPYGGKVMLISFGKKPLKTFEGIKLDKIIKGELEIHSLNDHKFKDSETSMSGLAHILQKYIEHTQPSLDYVCKIAKDYHY